MTSLRQACLFVDVNSQPGINHLEKFARILKYTVDEHLQRVMKARLASSLQLLAAKLHDIFRHDEVCTRKGFDIESSDEQLILGHTAQLDVQVPFEHLIVGAEALVPLSHTYQTHRRLESAGTLCQTNVVSTADFAWAWSIVGNGVFDVRNHPGTRSICQAGLLP